MSGELRRLIRETAERAQHEFRLTDVDREMLIDRLEAEILAARPK